ncbi:hypothetical protein BKA70DRAFT_1468460 [Coprinopsis sp. MPI-PUGE-AT-0042]|nr:hypothetical protein BKA70DRAFT_1468460 [Coprinopsis sp. MPI-PUGE-AT-0042]
MVKDIPWELIEAVADKCGPAVLAKLAIVSRVFQVVAEKRLYKSAIISEANQVYSRDYRLLQTLAASPRRAGYVQFFLVEFGRYRDWEIDGFSSDEEGFSDEEQYSDEEGICDDEDEEEFGMFGLHVRKKSRKSKDEDVEKDPRFTTWDATNLALEALENMHSLTDLRVKVRKGSSHLNDELDRIISAGSFKLKVLFCDSRLDLGTLVEAHRPTLEILVVWMSHGYNSTADLIPYMQPPTSGAVPQPPLIVVGFEPVESPVRSEEAMMLFPKYLPVYNEELGAHTRTVDEALGILKATFARDDRGRESLRLHNMSTVICCVESLPEAGVDASFTRPIAKHCTSVVEFVIYYDSFEGLLDDNLAASLSSFSNLHVLYVHGWDSKIESKWKEVPKAKIARLAQSDRASDFYVHRSGYLKAASSTLAVGYFLCGYLPSSMKESLNFKERPNGRLHQ